MKLSQAEIRAMVFALATVRDDWFEQPHAEMDFSYEEVESALMKVAAFFNLDDDTQGATLEELRNSRILR